MSTVEEVTARFQAEGLLDLCYLAFSNTLLDQSGLSQKLVVVAFLIGRSPFSQRITVYGINEGGCWNMYMPPHRRFNLYDEWLAVIDLDQAVVVTRMCLLEMPQEPISRRWPNGSKNGSQVTTDESARVSADKAGDTPA